jgi:mRNA interferase MazF
VKRGEVWTVSGGVYKSKPRPAVILQSDQFSETPSVTLVPRTIDPTEAPLFRMTLAPDDKNGLRSACRRMADKITTVPKANLGQRIGRLSDDDLTTLSALLSSFSVSNKHPENNRILMPRLVQPHPGFGPSAQ